MRISDWSSDVCSSDLPETQIRTVRNAAPAPRVIVDPNESWTFADVERLQPLLAELRIDLLEQPLPADDDDALASFVPLVPIAADESAHVVGDVGALREQYQVVNMTRSEEHTSELKSRM